MYEVIINYEREGDTVVAHAGTDLAAVAAVAETLARMSKAGIASIDLTTTDGQMLRTWVRGRGWSEADAEPGERNALDRTLDKALGTGTD